MQFDKGDTKEKCLFLSYHWQFSKLMGEAVPLAHNLEQIGPMAYGLISFKQWTAELHTCKADKQLDSSPCFPIDKIHIQVYD